MLNDFFPVSEHRLVIEEVVRAGYDGVSEFGVDLFPLKKPGGGYYVPAGGRGTNWAWPGRSTLALLAPGPDGPVATERFEMFREGVELAEALLFIERAIQEKKLSPALQQKAEKALEERSLAFIKNWFLLRDMPGAGEDAKLLGLAGEVAKAMGKK